MFVSILCSVALQSGFPVPLTTPQKLRRWPKDSKVCRPCANSSNALVTHLDFVGSGEESLFAHSSSLDRLFDMKNSAHENTDIFVRTESGDSLADSGWTAGAETRVLNGETYTQYNNESGETMYVQMSMEHGV